MDQTTKHVKYTALAFPEKTSPKYHVANNWFQSDCITEVLVCV